MARGHYNLPSLTTLTVFEAAARHLSFKAAAKELNVTPGAVSHQIKALEGDLGLALFERRHRGVDLTEAGRRLHQALERSFIDIAAALAHLRRAAHDESVTIASTTAMSALWLTPRIGRFWREHAGIAVNQVVSDTPAGTSAEADFRMSYGKDANPGKVHTSLFRDHLVPLCSPGFSARLARRPTLADLAAQPLIHLVSDERAWTTWQTWFAELGYRGDIAEGVRVNNYMIALQAAQDGAGLVLGWKRLVRPWIESQRLVCVGGHVIDAPERFYIVSDPDEMLSPNALLLRDWLLGNV